MLCPGVRRFSVQGCRQLGSCTPSCILVCTHPIFFFFSRDRDQSHMYNTYTMNSKSLEQARNLVKASYISQGEQALNGRRKQVGYTMLEDVNGCMAELPVALSE